MLLFTDIPNKLWILSDNNGLLFSRATIFMKILFESPYLTFIFSMLILFCLLQTSIFQSFLEVWKCSSIKIQGLWRTKMNEGEFQGLSRPWKRMRTNPVRWATSRLTQSKCESYLTKGQAGLQVFFVPCFSLLPNIDMYNAWQLEMAAL